jgi:hypothetical protein
MLVIIMRHFSERFIDTESLVGSIISIIGIILFLTVGDFYILSIGIILLLFSIITLSYEICTFKGD